MTPKDWAAESQRMTWFGAFAGTKLIGVIGLEYRLDVALLRHWYVRPEQQRTGAGSLLREHLERAASGVERLVAGTYRDNYKARGALEGGGWRLSDDSQAVLSAYHDIPPERAESPPSSMSAPSTTKTERTGAPDGIAADHAGLW